jgi:signal transduction histidine kinase
MHGDGSQRDVVLIRVAMPAEGTGSSGVLCVLMDVSEFRDAERAMTQARSLAEASLRAKSEFIANISHELRTPLQSILGFSELGMMRGREHARLAAMFTDIHGAGERMLALVNDLLDVSKIESSVGPFRMSRKDLRESVREVSAELDPLLAAKSLHLDLRLPDGELAAEVDALRMHQVLRNVLANAIKFSPAGTCIAIRAETSADQRIRIAVDDQGPGIPPDELERIFEPFVQSSQTKDGSGGTGLGLAICRRILAVHGGDIRAENLRGGGASFRIELPALQDGN